MLDAAGCDVVLVETVGVGQSEVEIAAIADTTLVLLAPGMGDGIQAAKAGILEIGDLYVVNKADRDGADPVRRDLRSMLALADRPEGAWKPPDPAHDVAQTGEGVDRGGRGDRAATTRGSRRPASWTGVAAPGPRGGRGDRPDRVCASAGAACTSAPSSTRSAAEVVGARPTLRRCGPAAGDYAEGTGA